MTQTTKLSTMNCYSQRIILLPGFGEDDKIFRNLNPYIEGYELLHVDYRDVLRKFNVDNITLKSFIDQMIKYYDITSTDILIGHSLGGFISHQIRQKVDCSNCLIASFTDPSKIKLPVSFKRLIKWLTMSGMFTSKVFKDAIYKTYENKPSVKEIEHTLTVFEDYGKEDIYKLIKIIEPEKRSWTNLFIRRKSIKPSMIIHPLSDWIVNRPDEAHITVPGDHFALATNFDIVGKHLETWLLSLHQEWAHSKELELERRIYEEYHHWVA